LRLLRQARALGDELVVVISNDAHNKKPNALPAIQRKQNLENKGIADKVVIGDADGFAATLRRLNPDILVLGYDQRIPDQETESELKKMGVDVVVMPWFPGKEDSSGTRC
jgi:FAD synthetase